MSDDRVAVDAPGGPHDRAQQVVDGREQERVEDDRDGTYLRNAEAALSYADYTIRELRKKSRYKDDLSLAMIVEDQARQTVLSLPFFPGC